LNINIIGRNSFDFYYVLRIVVDSNAQLERVEDILKQLRVFAPPLDEADRFVCLLKTGGFLYFDSTYDIVAANSICFDEVQEGASALYLGTHSDRSFLVTLFSRVQGASPICTCQTSRFMCRWYPRRWDTRTTTFTCLISR
jgi:hypothetical protein